MAGCRWRDFGYTPHVPPVPEFIYSSRTTKTVLEAFNLCILNISPYKC